MQSLMRPSCCANTGRHASPPLPTRLLLTSLLPLAACGGEAPLPAPQGGIAATPLAAARGGDGPRFRRLDGAACGVTFQNLLLPENSYQYLTNGAGLAVGDYDGDGLVDLYLVSQDGPNRLYRQRAALRFEDVTDAAGGLGGGDAWGTGATFVDIDGDGDLDLYVCNLHAKNLLYENQGNGSFRENAAAYGLDLVAASMMASFADYDRDGKLDLYLLTNRALSLTMTPGWTTAGLLLPHMKVPKDTVLDGMLPDPAQLQLAGDLQRQGKLRTADDLPAALRDHLLVFRGQAFPTGQEDRLLRRVGARFVDVSRSAGVHGSGMGLSATWFDYDDDGYPDLYVANDLESPDTLYHNERNGTFRDVTAEVVPHTAYYGMGSDAGDVDGDGRLDLLVADMSMTTHKKAKVLMGDMNDRRDLLIHAVPPQCMRNALLLNTGLGRFQEAAILAGVASTDWTWSVLFGDLDNDSRLDLLATNGIARFDTDPDLELRLDTLWAEGRQQAAVELIRNVKRVPEKNLALRNAGDLEFTKTGASWGLDLEAVSHSGALVDLDGDGDLDVVVNNWNEPAAIYENLTTDGNGLVVRLRGQRSDRFGVGARLLLTLPDGSRLVRENTLARGYLSGQAPEVHFGLGKHDRATSLVVRWPSGHEQSFSDLEARHRYTITEPPEKTTMPRLPTPAATSFQVADAPLFHHRENEFDEYVAQPLLPAGLARLGPGLALGDFDGDGRDDLFVGGAMGQAGELFQKKELGWQKVPGPWRDDAGCEDLGVLWLDHDGDLDLDLFVASGGAERASGDAALRDRCYRNDGGGRFVRDDTVLPDVRESSGAMVAADIDGDLDLDLFVAGRLLPGHYPDAPRSRLYRNDGGRFVDVGETLAPALATAGMVTAALFTDVDADGRPDLLLAAHWQPIRYLHNDGGSFSDRTADAGLAAFSGWWNSLAAFDIDADGDLDYLAGNQGLNTKYKASPERPARLFFGDFDGNGSRDLVEAKYEGDRLLPVRGRSCSSQAMPFLAQEFPTYDAFASSLLTDIYTQPKLDGAGQLAATTLASSLLRNDGTGRFTVEPLPRRAQIAPIFGMVVLDDLVVCAQNSFAPEPETGHHDGGTGLVLQAGANGLVVLPPDQHGICFHGDRKALVALPGARGAECLFSRNDAPLVLVRGSVPLTTAKLPGAAGNPQAVGTRLLVEDARGNRRAVEVAAGSGYLSQSRPLLPVDQKRIEARLPDGKQVLAEVTPLPRQ
ncbi:MAG: VCBS repeat-containing protein [Planctomycetes bacterium]|nr:VCBS repeat-containing protein [Planctomycetota bacterium]